MVAREGVEPSEHLVLNQAAIPIRVPGHIFTLLYLVQPQRDLHQRDLHQYFF